MTDMREKVCLVTGATDGHGLAVAEALARQGADVILLGRNAEKCRRAQHAVAAAAGGKPPEILLCDLASPDQVDRAAGDFLAGGRPLHLLVNNAGLVNLKRRENARGTEMTFAVNYLSMFQLTLRLIDRLVESAPARIVNISSDAYRIAKLDLGDLMLERRYSVTRAYAQSKLAVLLFTLELARRLDGTGVTVNAVDPGPVASNIGANNPGLLYSLARPLIRTLLPSPARAARTALLVATSEELADRTGGYYRSRRQRESPLATPDPEKSAALWRESVRLTGVDFPRPR